MLKKIAQYDNLVWYHGEKFSRDDVKQVLKDEALHPDMQDYLDVSYPEVDAQYDGEQAIAVIDVPVAVDNKANSLLYYSSVPVSFILLPQMVITFARETVADSEFLDVLKEALTDYQSHEPEDFVADIVEEVLSRYHHALHDLNRSRRHIEGQLVDKNKMTRHLNELVANRSSVVQLRNSLTSIHHMLKKHDGGDAEPMKDDDVHELLARSEQLLSSYAVSRDMLDEISQSYRDFWEQRLNKTMKELTIAGLVLTMPSLVFGFYGQNTKLPFESAWWGWILTIGLGVLLIAPLFYWLYKADYFER
jgi:Mg2+ and Co2+ transporter CorA